MKKYKCEVRGGSEKEVVICYATNPHQAVNRAKRKYCEKHGCEWRDVSGKVTLEYLWLSGWVKPVKIDRAKVFREFDGRCGYCGKRLLEKNWHVDHVFPRYKGGSDDISNLLPSCVRCNLWKKTFTVEEFRHEIKMQVKRIRRDSAGFRLAEDFGQVIAREGVPVRFYFETPEEVK